MKIKVKREESFSLEFGQFKLDNLKVKSVWNSLTELVDSKGRSLIVSGLNDGSFGDVFGKIFGQTKDLEITVIQGSPDLIHALKVEVEKQKETPA